ncbi:MAG: hypothetical protein OEZ22_12810 [Spirochaetia bacterium]|nr:hypothetical protein [Spirochaetia bacterium]
MYTFRFTKRLVLFLIFGFSLSLSAAQLKKVLILDIVNIEKNSNYQYLEVSITEAVANSLKKKFAFEEMRKYDWEEVAENNYFFRDDLYTRSIAMNMGLLSKQDVVISGGFKIISSAKAKSPALQKEKDTEIIATEVRILDIAKKRIIAEFVEEGPADNRIFQSVEKIAIRISEEARAVLPSREEWEKKGATGGSSEPIFGDYAIGLRAGGGLYLGGWASHFELEQPSLGISFLFHIPILWDKLAVQVDFMQTEHKLKEDVDSSLNNMNYRLSASNLILGGFFMVDFKLSRNFALHPKLGGGYIMQEVEITGSTNETSNNSLPFAGAGVELSYKINRTLNGILVIQSFLESEGEIFTSLNNISLGINYRM